MTPAWGSLLLGFRLSLSTLYIFLIFEIIDNPMESFLESLKNKWISENVNYDSLNISF